jgi:hypothetical protein
MIFSSDPSGSKAQVVDRQSGHLAQSQAEDAWRDQQADFFSPVVGPHFASLCRSFAMQASSGRFGVPVGEVGSGVVNDPANRTQIEIDVAVLAPTRARTPPAAALPRRGQVGPGDDSAAHCAAGPRTRAAGGQF